MSDEPEEVLQLWLAQEFQRRGWSYDMETVPAILDDVRARGAVEPERAAQSVPRVFLDRNDATRADVADAIRAALGEVTIAPPATPLTIVTHNDNRHQVHVGGSVTGSVLQAGGQQIVAQTTSPKDDVLAAVRALVGAGLDGRWDAAAAADIDAVLAQRLDITPADIQATANDVARSADAQPGQLKAFLNKVAAGGLGGAMSTGLVAAITALL